MIIIIHCSFWNKLALMEFNPEFLFIQHDACCPPELGAKALQMRNINFKIVYGNYPGAFTHIYPTMFKGIIVLGGHMAAWEDDKHQWLHDLKLFLKQALHDNIPILGLCLGAQILATVIGGNNFVGAKGHEFGYYDLHWTQHANNDGFCNYIRSNHLHRTMPYSHGDTFSLPQSQFYYTENGHKLPIKLLANTTTPYISIFKVGDMSYGFQAHPECDNELQNVWIDLDSDIIHANGHGQNPDVLKKDAEKQTIKQDENGCKLLSKWFDLCLEHHAKNKHPAMSSKL
eukprot:20361_1